MKTTKQTSRRGFIDKLFKGLALSTAASLLVPNKIYANNATNKLANIYAMWTHGCEGKILGPFYNGVDPNGFVLRLIDKAGIFLTHAAKRDFVKEKAFAGHSILLGGEAAGTMIPTSNGALFTIWDKGQKSKAKNGEFWVNYTIPTPAIANGVRVKASKILVKCASSDANFYITDVELWDANERIYNKENLKLWGPDKMYDFSFGDNPRTVKYGLCVSLKIKGEQVLADRILVVSGVGVDLIA